MLSISDEMNMATASAIDSRRINQSVLSTAKLDVTLTRPFATSIIVHAVT